MAKINFDLIVFNKETKKGDFIIGLKSIEKAVKKKEITKIYISKDILKEILLKLEKISTDNKISLINTDLNKEQLAEICKKPFLISAVGIKISANLTNNDEDKEEYSKEKKERSITKKAEKKVDETKIKEKKEVSKKEKKEKDSGKK